MTELATQLQSIMLTRIFVGNFSEVFVPWITYQIAKYKSTGSVEASNELSATQKEAEKPVFGSDKVSGTFYNYVQLAIQFGYVVLFAPAFPLAPVLALISNMVSTSADGVLLLDQIQKPIYRGAADIGPWFSVFNFLCIVAVLTNSLIIGFTSVQLDVWLNDPSTGTKWLVIIITEHCVLGILWLIAEFIPDVPGWVRIKKAHQDKIQWLEAAYQLALADWKHGLHEQKSRGKQKEKDEDRFKYDSSEDQLVAQRMKEAEEGKGLMTGSQEKNNDQTQTEMTGASPTGDVQYETQVKDED